jgi:hypothetical protein
LLATGDWPDDLHASWRNRDADRPTRNDEYLLERAVSDYIGAMPMFCLAVDDRALRGVVERNTIALLSCRSGGLDRPSVSWLGQFADSDKIRTSALWNVNHVDAEYDDSYLEILDSLVSVAGWTQPDLR